MLDVRWLALAAVSCLTLANVSANDEEIRRLLYVGVAVGAVVYGVSVWRTWRISLPTCAACAVATCGLSWLLEALLRDSWLLLPHCGWNAWLLSLVFGDHETPSVTETGGCAVLMEGNLTEFACDLGQSGLMPFTVSVAFVVFDVVTGGPSHPCGRRSLLWSVVGGYMATVAVQVLGACAFLIVEDVHAPGGWNKVLLVVGPGVWCAQCLACFWTIRLILKARVADALQCEVPN